MVWAFFKVHVFLNSKLSQIIYKIDSKLTITSRHGWDWRIIMNFGREPGFSKLVFFEWFLPWQFSYVTHGGSTKMSAECSIIERHKIIKIVSKFSKLSKIVQISKLGFIFGLWGWASFLSVDWFPACSDSEKTSITTSTLNQHTHRHHKLTTSSCVCQQSLPRLRVVCHHWLPVPWVCLLCQHTSHIRSVPACQRVIPEVCVLP